MSSMSRIYYSLLARLFTRMPGRARGQRGASALEYIVLAAALINIIGVLATNTTVQDTLTGAFEGLFEDAAAGGGG